MPTKNGTIHVVDGTTGAIKTEVDGKPAIVDTTKPPTQQTLISVPREELIHDYNRLFKIREGINSKAGYWRQKSKEYDERIEPILAELRRRDDEEKSGQRSFDGIHDTIAKLEAGEPQGGNE